MIIVDFLIFFAVYAGIRVSYRLIDSNPDGFLKVRPHVRAILENIDMCPNDWYYDNRAGGYINDKITPIFNSISLTWREKRLLDAALEKLAAQQIAEKTLARALER